MLVEIEARVARGMVGIEERSQALSLTAQELFERFIEDYRDPKIKNIAAYRCSARARLTRVNNEVPKIAQLALTALDSTHIARLRDGLMRRYPAGTVRTTLIAVSTALSRGGQRKVHRKESSNGRTTSTGAVCSSRFSDG